jgi:hypothetical protein
MPKHIKLFVSILTLLVGALFYYFETKFGQSHVAIVGACLSVFMVFAMWVFPEVGNREKK